MRRRRTAPQEVPAHLLVYDRTDWPVLTDDEAADAWSAAGMEWCEATGYPVVDFIVAKRAARLALPPAA